MRLVRFAVPVALGALACARALAAGRLLVGSWATHTAALEANPHAAVLTLLSRRA